MTVRVYGVSIPAGSTIATCTGVDVDSGAEVRFAGDQRVCRDVGAAIQVAADEDDLPVCEVENWQVLP